ncbi:ORC1-type DNA replication protein [Candidatus Woesearchaeota archaeon]|nr:ORC1-type DNA replication protein [Candidatus Woesearchaeota archaeon]
MVQEGLSDFFKKYIESKSLFSNKAVLQSAYNPEGISHRDKEISTIASILAPVLKFEKPSNLFIYGKSGCGKTLCTRHVASELEHSGNGKVKVVYVNCKLKKVADTEYRLIAQIAREYGKSIPPTGLPTDEIYRIFQSALDSQRLINVIILDEIDELVKKTGDEILYNLTRINEDLKKSRISIIGISNDMVFLDSLDPRVKSSLSEEEVVFVPYNAMQLQSILSQRVKLAFNKGVVEPGVIEKCAAFAAREHGDARRCLELMRVAGEIADRANSEKVGLEHIDAANDKIEKDRILDILTSQPKQFQATLYAIFCIGVSERKDLIFTGDVYEIYKDVCSRLGMRPLTQRRVSDIIAELDMLGIINVKVISKGRYGRTREITISLPSVTLPRIKRLLEEELSL